MSTRDYIKLKDVCDVNQGLQIPISKRFLKGGPNRYFYITIQFLKESHDEKHFVENPPKSSICTENDILVVRTGSTGKIVTGVNGSFHNNFFKINYDPKLINPRYLYYVLTSKEKQSEMKRRSGITTIPDLNHFMFLDMEIPITSLRNQEKIASILDLLNSKIELNNKINAELEAMAKLVYDYWFVQFDFPMSAEQAAALGKPELEGKPYKASGGKMVYNKELKREIPEGWEVKELMEICNRIGDGIHGTPNYVDESEFSFINGNNLKNGFIQVGEDTKKVSKDEYLKHHIDLNDNSILISINGTLGNLALYNNEKVMLGKSSAYINCKEGYKAYCLQLLEQDYMQKLFWKISTGSTIKNLSLKSIKELKILIPPQRELNKINSMLSGINGKRQLNFSMNLELSKLRDWLLPMLMNGQVTVGDAEEKVAEYSAGGEVSVAAEGKGEYDG